MQDLILVILIVWKTKPVTNLNASVWPLHSYAQYKPVFLIYYNAQHSKIATEIFDATWADLNVFLQLAHFIHFYISL